jgi:hypothetical protein
MSLLHGVTQLGVLCRQETRTDEALNKRFVCCKCAHNSSAPLPLFLFYLTGKRSSIRHGLLNCLISEVSSKWYKLCLGRRHRD